MVSDLENLGNNKLRRLITKCHIFKMNKQALKRGVDDFLYVQSIRSLKETVYNYRIVSAGNS